MRKIILFAFLILFISSSHTYSQLYITTNISANQVIQNYFVGNGISISNITTNSTPINENIGVFSNGQNTNIGLVTGLIMATGSVLNAIGPNNTSSAGNATNTGGDANLAALIPGYTINDACVIEFDFVPHADSIFFNYVFASEEYPEYVSSSFNDVFGFFISGPIPGGGFYNSKNIAIIPDTNLPVCINNINNVIPSYPQYYVSNVGGPTIQYDGFTTVLTAKEKVMPCQTYHMKLAIGDAGDMILDSGVFLDAFSFASNAVQYVIIPDTSNPNSTYFEGCSYAHALFLIPFPSPDTTWITYNISGTAINGVDYSLIPDSIPVLPWHDTASLVIDILYDTLIENNESIIIKPTHHYSCVKDSMIIIIKDYHQIHVDFLFDTIVTTGGSINLYAQVSGGFPPYTYTYYPLSGLTNITGPNPVANPSISTMYTVNVIDSTGCSIGIDSVYIMVVGIDEIENTYSKVEIYPNPANESIDLYFNTNNYSNKRFNLVDLSGKIVKRFIYLSSDTKYKLPVDDISPGIYVLQLFQNDEVIQSSKIIILKDSK